MFPGFLNNKNTSNWEQPLGLSKASMDASELKLKYVYNTCFTINELLYMITYDLKTEKDLNKQSFSFKQQIK